MFQTAFNDYHSVRQVTHSTSLDYAILYALASKYTYSRLVHFASVGDGAYFFTNSQFLTNSGHLLPNQSFYPFAVDDIVYDKDYSSVSYVPSSDDPYQTEYLVDYSRKNLRNSVDVSYTLSVLALNRGLLLYRALSGLKNVDGSQLSESFTYNGETHYAYYYSDEKYPLGVFLCYHYPSFKCLLNSFISMKVGDDSYTPEFAVPILISDSTVYANGRLLFMAWVFYPTLDEAVEAMESYDTMDHYARAVLNISNTDYYTHYDAYYFYQSTKNEYSLNSNCGNCSRVLILNIAGTFVMNSYGGDTDPYIYLYYGWDYFAETPPTQLVENILECQLSFRDALIQGVGIAAGNIQLAFTVGIAVLTPLTIIFFHFFRGKHKTPKTKEEESCEKLLVLLKAAQTRLMRELDTPLTLNRFVSMLENQPRAVEMVSAVVEERPTMDHENSEFVSPHSL